MCLRPYYQPAYKGKDGRVRPVWTRSGACLRLGDFPSEKISIAIPCGRCVQCLKQYSQEWCGRILAECDRHEENCFLTLTYGQAPISVEKREIQLFIKRLRKEVGELRYFACGEYGSLRGRPHYHAIIFGWRPHDLEFFFKDKSGLPLYKSETVARVWQAGEEAPGVKRGFITVGDVTPDSALYVAKYMQKARPLNEGEKPSFTLMSKRPIIGANKATQDLIRLCEYAAGGKSFKVPRAYVREVEKNGGDVLDVWLKRQERAQMLEKRV